VAGFFVFADSVRVRGERLCCDCRQRAAVTARVARRGGWTEKQDEHSEQRLFHGAALGHRLSGLREPDVVAPFGGKNSTWLRCVFP